VIRGAQPDCALGYIKNLLARQTQPVPLRIPVEQLRDIGLCQYGDLVLRALPEHHIGITAQLQVFGLAEARPGKHPASENEHEFGRVEPAFSDFLRCRTP
jgi:hypothetical protein